jgi:hypothetical protein
MKRLLLILLLASCACSSVRPQYKITQTITNTRVTYVVDADNDLFKFTGYEFFIGNTGNYLTISKSHRKPAVAAFTSWKRVWTVEEIDTTYSPTVKN